MNSEKEPQIDIQALMDLTPDGYLRTTGSGVIEAANAAAEALLHSGHRPLAGQSILSFVEPAQDRDGLLARLATLAEGEQLEVELSLCASGGHCFPAAVRVRHQGQNGSATWHWLLRDVTSQRRAEELAARDPAARDRAIRESMSDGLVVFDLEGDILDMNPAALRLHGFASTEEMRRHVGEYGPLFDLSDRNGRPIPVDDWPLSRVLRGETVTAFEARVHHVRTGERPVWSYNGSPVRDQAGNVILGVLTIRDVTVQKEVEQALRSQFVFLEQLIAQAPVGIAVIIGPDHRFELVNPHYRNVSTVSGAPVAGQTVAEVLGEAAGDALALIEEVYRTRETVSVREYEARARPGGEDTYWNVDLVPLLGRDEQVERVLILTHEVTDQVRARRRIEQVMAELADERARLDAIIRNAPEGVVVADAQARILLTNPVADRLYARPVPYGQEYESHAELRLCHPDGTPYDPRHLPLTRSALDGETLHEVEVDIVWPDGQRRNLLVNTAPVYGAGGAILGAVSMFQDITERTQTGQALRRARDELEDRVRERTRVLTARTHDLQRANQELAAAEEDLRLRNEDLRIIEEELRSRNRELVTTQQRYQELFDFAPDGYLLTDSGATILEANQAAGDMLGVPSTELRGQGVDHYVLPGDVPTCGAYLHRLRTGGESSAVRAEMRFQPARGEVIHVAVAATVLYSASGEVEALRWLLRDVTQEKRLQAALIQSERLSMLGQLAASLAHEINNPLSAAIGCVDLVREAIDEGQDPSDTLNVIRSSLQRTARIVSRLRDLHRPEQEEKRLADLNEMVEAALLLMSKHARSAQVEIAWQRAAELPLLPIMVDGLHQVFLNIVLNAVEAMNGGGHLSVRIVRAEGPSRVGVQFADDGPGIALEVREVLFEPFTSTKRGGSGLGLFVSQNIVQQHGGSIEVETAMGEGSTFTVWLPCGDGSQ